MSQVLAIEVRNQLFKKKMTMTELAEKMDLSVVYVSDIINGKKDGPKAQQHIKRMKYILGIE